MNTSYKIDTKSWLYKLTRHFFSKTFSDAYWGDTKITICQYFWMCVASIIFGLLSVCLALILAVVFLGAASAFAYISFNAILGIFGAFFGIYFDWINYSNSHILIFVVDLLILCAVAEEFCARGKPSWWITSTKIEAKENKQPNIILSMYRAYKEKYCKFVEFE